MAYIYMRPEQPFDPVVLDESTLAALQENSEENAAEVVRLASQGVFPPVASAGASCRNCSFQDLCRATPADRIEWKLENDPELLFLRNARRR